MIKKMFGGLMVCCLLAGPAWAQTFHIPDTGDPAEQACNPHSYTDLGTGIVRDNTTGLEWMQATAPGTYTWDTASDYIDDLNDNETLGLGYTDWRLPTIEELSSLVDAGRFDPAIDPVFDDTAASYYWSSTTDAYNTDFAWIVYFGSGYVDYGGKGDGYYVRAVRGGPYGPFGDFVDNGDGTITDASTGLMWQRCGYGQDWDEENDNCTGSAAQMHWDAASDYVDDLNDSIYLDHADWRLPTRNELQMLVDYSIYIPATAFPETAAYHYCSSTTFAINTGSAWSVSFFGGSVDASESRSYYVRAVRGGPCRSFGDWCLEDTDCDNSTPYCDNGTSACVECLSDTDCNDGRLCRDMICTLSPCNLNVSHRRIRAKKLTKPREVVLTITSQDEGFDMFDRIDLGPLDWKRVRFNHRKNRLKIVATVPAGLDAGAVPISVGNCTGEVVIE